MGTYNVEIGDGTGKSFKLKIETVFATKVHDGHWRSIDKGFIRFNSGKAIEVSDHWYEDSDLKLLDKNDQWGIYLNKFTGRLWANDHGVGKLVQPWVLKAKPGKISWVILD